MKNFKSVLTSIGFLFSVLAFVSCNNSNESEKIDIKQKDIEFVKSVMSTQNVSIEKIELTKATNTPFLLDTIKSDGRGWPICGTKRAAIIKKIMEEKGILPDDLK